MPMEVEFTLTEADHVAYWGYLWDHPPKGDRTNRKRLTAVCMVWLFAVGVLFFHLFHPPDAFGLLIAAVVGGVAVMMTLDFAVRRQRYAFWSLRYIRKHPEQGWFERRRLSISPDGIAWSTRHTSVQMSWVRVQEIGRTEGLVVFRTVQPGAFLLPKRAFPDESDFVRFVETAERWWEEARESAGPDE